MSEAKSPKLRWPRRGDRIRRTAADPRLHKEIPNSAEGRDAMILRAYKIAANSLFEKGRDDPAKWGLLIYPMMFCYRHFLELALKRQIRNYAENLGIKPGTIHRTRDLKKLLVTYVKMCKDTTPGDSYDLAFVIRAIKDFIEIDPHSCVFRYSSDRSGNPYPFSPNEIDVDNLRDKMEGIATFLWSTDWYLDEFGET